MTPRKFEELLCWVAPRVLKSNVKREAIRPEERLFVTLRYVVTGDVVIGSARPVPVALLKKPPNHSSIKDF